MWYLTPALPSAKLYILHCRHTPCGDLVAFPTPMCEMGGPHCLAFEIDGHLLQHHTDFHISTFMIVQDADSAALTKRTFQQRLNDPPVLSFGALPRQAGGGPLHERGLALHFSAVKSALPFNLHLLTLKALPKDRILLRLAHLYQVTQCCTLAECCVSATHPVVHPLTDPVTLAAIH